jgi:hypothetical protein
MSTTTNSRRQIALACAALGLVAMTAAYPVFAQTAAATPASTGGAIEGSAPGSANLSLSDRLVNAYKDSLKWNGDPADSPQTWREGYQPPPESSPPMPFTAWPIGGTEVIGYDNSYSGPLMDALYAGPNGQAWKDSRVTVYGWFNPGMNISSSHSNYNTATGTGGNYPAAYSYRPNTMQMDQVALYVERTPDVVQKEHFDWGFRIAGLWGTDAKYTFSQGLFSSQYNTNGAVSTYGYDIPMAYVEGYFPWIADGMNVRIGRYISIPDIEAQLAPNNYTYSHSLLYTYDPYTHEGVVATVKLNKNWTVQGELSAGNDVALWYHPTVPGTYTNAAGATVANPNAGQKIGAQLTPSFCVNWVSDSGNDSLYPCINAANAGNYGWNNVQQDVVTYYHKFNDKWHTSTEAWYMQQKNTPNTQNADGASLYSSYGFPSQGSPFAATGGAGCTANDGVTCTSKEWAIVNYIVYQPTPRDYFTLRTEMMNDVNGQRTGAATKYTEVLLGWDHWIGKTITLRPELRYEHAGLPVYNNTTGNPTSGGSNHQLMVAMDAIIHF